jgi:hypothetical protein
MATSDCDGTGIYTTMKGERREIRIELLEPEIGEFCSRLTPAQRLMGGAYLNRLARQIIRDEVADLHPDWSSEQIDCEVARRWLNEEFSERVKEEARPYEGVHRRSRLPGLHQRVTLRRKAESRAAHFAWALQTQRTS